MTIGTAIGASAKVRTTVDMGASQSLNVTFSTVSVGNTHSQIIRASWWRLGGAGRDEVGSGVIGGAFRWWGGQVAVTAAGVASAAAMSARTRVALMAMATAEPSPAAVMTC